MSLNIHSLFKNIQLFPVIWGFIFINILLLITLELTSIQSMHVFFMPANKGELISKFWTVITPSFIHYTLLHLMTNLYLFWLLGAQLEKHSKMQFIAFVMATAVISNCVQWIVVGPNFGGMSGVVYALLGFIWITQYFKSSYYIDNSIAMVLLVLIPVGFTGWIGKLANYAHVSGLISGIIIGLFSLFINQLKKP